MGALGWELLRDAPVRVAVLGVPRGGTSMVVGLLRVLGYRLPDADPDCVLGESRLLRWVGSPMEGDPKALAVAVGALPDGVVWKDPAVALYADHINWSGWSVVRVRRDPHAVAESEQRWIGARVDPMIDRAREWGTRLDRIPAVLELGFAAVRNRPLLALEALGEVTGRAVTLGARTQALAFVRADPGYHCPTPGSCPLTH